MKHSISTILLSFMLFLAVTFPQNLFATHSVTASPEGGVYTTAQSISLNSSEPLASIFYTTDGSDPDASSTLYNGGAIIILENTTLKFLAIDPADNHTSSIVTETYVINNDPATVAETEPVDGGRRVSVSIVINVTFSQPMDDASIDEDTFLVTDQNGDQVIGSVTYGAGNNTASFTPDDRLVFGLVYTVELTDGIQDANGNPLTDYTWSFTTGGQIRIFIRDIQSFDLIPGSAFTITPDPFTLGDSMVVADNGPIDADASVFGEVKDGIIVINDVENSFVTYRISESTLPTGYSRIWGDALVTVVEALECDSCNPISPVVVDNLSSNSSITDVDANISVPAPYLDQEQFELYRDNVIIGRFNGIQGDIDPITDVQSPNPPLPSAQIATSTTIDELLAITLFEAFNFFTTASPSLSGPEIFQNFLIPTYPGPQEGIADQVIYAVPAAVIPYEGSKNNFVLSPIIEQVFPGEQVVIMQPSFVETNVAKVSTINMTFNLEANNVGFSFGITNTPPPGTPNPPLDAPALFLDIGFVGDGDFSDPNSFQTSPKIDILVNKTLSGFPELPNGCPDFRLLFFNGNDWEEVQKLNPTGNFTDFCPFTLEPEHFSKFAVGGVKGQTIATEGSPASQDEESDRHIGGGGRSRSTAITQTPTGSDVETTINTASGIVSVHFETVEEGSGQLKIEANELSVFEDLFDELGFLSQDNHEHGIVNIDGNSYATAGDVFDIDASLIKYEGSIDVTIPYDENSVVDFGPESGVRFLHYNEELDAWEDETTSVGETANTVTGNLDSLSPVVAAIILNGAGDIGDIPQTQLASLGITVPPVTVSEGGQEVISADLTNNQTRDQNYVILVQVVDEQNIVQSIDWQTGSLKPNQNSHVSMNLDQMQKGSYSIQVLLLTDLQNPWLLSPPVKTQLEI